VADGVYSAGSIFLQVVPSFQGFEAAARRTAKKMEGIFEESLDQAGERGAERARRHMDDALGGPEARRSGRRGGQQVGDEFSGAFETTMKKRVAKAMDAIGESGGAQVEKIRQQLASLRDARVGVDLDAGAAIAEIKELDKQINELAKNSASIDVRVNAKAAAAELAAFNKELKGVDGKRVNVRVDFDDRASNKLAAFNRLMGRTGSHAEDTANSFRAFNAVVLTTATLGPALVPVLTAIAGGLLALGPAAVAAASGLGALAIAFSGIGDAVKALNDVQKNAGKDLLANSKRIRNAAESVEDAERRLTRTARDASRQRSDAARRVADAQESASRQIESALDRQEQAEKNLADAQRDATKAQQDLREARRQAAKDQEDIAAKQKQNQLDERQAVIDLFNATVEYNAIQKDGGATNLEREQASISLEQARLRLEEIRKEEKDLAEERQKGIKGSEKVQTAEENVASAVERQKDAQENLQDAVKETARAQKDAARDVADALEDQKRAQVESAEAVADAQRALARSQADYTDALVQSNELGSASMQNLKNAMDALGPAGQRFAMFIFSLKDEFYAIRNAVQAGLFPGLQEAIQTLVTTYLPDFTQFMGTLGEVFGDIARLTSQTLTNDIWKDFFSVFRDVSPDLIRNYAAVFLNLATVLAQLATITAPFAVQFSKGLADLTAQMVAFMGTAEGQKLWTDFLDQVKRLGPPVLRFFEAMVPAFLALVEALMPLGEIILRGLTALLEWIAALDPKVLQGIVFTIITLVVAFQAAAGIIAGLAAIMTPFGAAIGGIVVGIVALIGVLVYLYTTSETARTIINAVFGAIATAVQFYFQKILIPYWSLWGKVISEVAQGLVYAWQTWIWPALQAIWNFVSDLWKTVLSPIFTAFGKLVSKVFGDIKWAWDNVLGPVIGVIAKIVWELWSLAFKVAFDAIGKGFSALADGFQWVYEHAIYPLLNAFAKAFGVDLNGKSLKSGLVAAFQIAMKFIGAAWDGLKTLAKGPIDFVVRTVLNGGLIKGFNFLADKLGMDKVDPIPWPPEGFADGGIPYGVRPGYTPGRDTHLIHVGGGEAILRPELTRALGADWVYAANARAKRGGVLGAKRFLGGFKDGGVAWPVPGYGTGTPFGKRGPMWSSGFHTGTDFPAPTGTPIHAVMGGRVSGASWSSWGGNLMKIITKGLGEWYYAHQSRFARGLGDEVKAGDLIGYVGATGNTTGPHLHLELRVGGTPVDPMRTILGGATGIGEREEVKKPSKLESLLGNLKDAAGWIKDAVANPLNWLKSKVEGPLNKMTESFGDTWLTRGLKRLPDKFFGALVDRIKGLVGAGNDEDMAPWNGTTSDLQRMVQAMAQSKYGWEGSQWSALNWLISHESSWNPNAQNPTSSAYGLFQFLDGTWAPYGKKTSDPAKQAEFGLKYIKDRYGSPEKAKAFWEGHHWYSDGGVVPEGGAPGLPDNGTMMYDNGGFLPPGLTTVVNLTGKPEPVFTADQFDRMRGGAGGGFQYSPTFVGTDLTAEDVASDILFAAKRVGRGGVYAGGRP
jgi:hypothetical protein